MTVKRDARNEELVRLLFEAESTIQALLAGQIDAVVDPKSKTPVLLSKAQDALRESEERYRRIVETSNEGIWSIDLDSNITFLNRPLAKMLGYTVEEMLGKPLQTFMSQSTGARAALRIDHSREGGSDESEAEFVRKDGGALWGLLKTTPILDVDGQYAGTLAMMTDRTRHRAAEEALRNSQEQYRQIVETTTDGIIKMDDRARVVFVNRRFAEMLGYMPAEMIGESIFTFMSAAGEAIARGSMQSQLSVRPPVDTTFRHKDGRDISVNVASTQLVDDNGNRIGDLAFVRDITEQKKLQSQLMVSDRMASVGTLAAGVAHEINNPLAAVIANLDYMSDSLVNLCDGDKPRMSDAWFREEMKSPLDDAREAAQRVRFIVRDLKIFSRSPNEEPCGAVDVNAIMESSLRMAWNEIRHRARLTKQFGVVPGVDANEARLGQVFLNLVVNAAQAMPEGRAEHHEIRVTTRLEKAHVIVEVSDTGPGIPPEILGRIFDAFFTTKDIGVGTGLGLAICHRIVTDLHGELTVQSEVGIGTTFRVSLPVASDEQPLPVVTEIAPVIGRRGKILVVDDEMLVLSSLHRVLSKEHDVTTVLKAKDALALCTSGKRFDLILCDLMMPDMTGMDLHRELTSLIPEQAAKMIFLTGGTFTAEGQRFLSETSKEHVEKPFHPANMRAIVQRHLR